MKQKKYPTYLFFILTTLGAGGLSSFAVMRGMPAYMMLEKPPLTPPPVVFPIAWGILYVLMAIGAARVWLTHAPDRDAAIAVYGVQLVVNLFWSVWFFAAEARLFAFFWLLLLIVLIVLMRRCFSRLDPLAGRLQLPYLLWSLFAAYLNFGAWWLNR